ncbi:15996_t:CDS:2, partial [Cetraspora pellucida]
PAKLAKSPNNQFSRKYKLRPSTDLLRVVKIVVGAFVDIDEILTLHSKNKHINSSRGFGILSK